MSVICVTKRLAYWGERSLHDAIKLIYKGKAEILSADEECILNAGTQRDGSTNGLFAPLVIRLKDFGGYHVKEATIELNKYSVFARDKGICQYWHYDEKGNRFQYRCRPSELTMDHVFPKGRKHEKGPNWNPDTWENCVTACKTCNVKIKKGRTPEEAGLELIRKPFTPVRRKGDIYLMSFLFNPEKKAHQAFQNYLSGVI